MLIERRNARPLPLESIEYYYSYEQRENFENMDFLRSTIQIERSNSNGYFIC